LSVGDIDFSVAGWIYLDAKGADRMLASHWEQTGNQRSWVLEYQNSSDRFAFLISSNGSASVTRLASSFGSPSTATWYFIVASHNSSSDTISISVNNGTVDSTSYGTGGFDSTADFRVGRASFVSWMDGRIDELGFWKKALSASEITELYNSGAGKTCCPF
jgi:hypothetical protein